MTVVNLYAMRKKLMEMKADYLLRFPGDTNKLDGDLYEESILEYEEEYKRLCKLYNDYDPSDIAFNW